MDLGLFKIKDAMLTIKKLSIHFGEAKTKCIFFKKGKYNIA